MKNKFSRSAVVLLLVTSLIISSFAFCFANETDTTLNYVALGNSATCGYNFKAYMKPMYEGRNSLGYRLEIDSLYPFLFRSYLEKNLTKVNWQLESNFETVELDPIAFAGARVQDYRYLIEYGNPDAYPVDEQTEAKFVDDGELIGYKNTFVQGAEVVFGLKKATTATAIQAFHDDIVESLEDADMITIELGPNELGTYTISKIQDGVEVDLDGLLKEVGIPVGYDFLVSLVIDELRNSGIVDQPNYQMFKRIAETIVYDYIDFCVNYDGLLKDIIELNPDAKIIVMDPFYGDYGTGNVGGVRVDLSKISGVAEILEKYYQKMLSSYKNCVTYCDRGNRTIELFTDEGRGPVADYSEDLKYGIDMALIKGLNMKEKDLKNIKAGKSIKVGEEDVTITIDELYENFKFYFDMDLRITFDDEPVSKEDCLKYLLGLEVEADEADVKDSIFAYLFAYLGSYAIHPTAKGHYTKFLCLKDAFKLDRTPKQTVYYTVYEAVGETHEDVADQIEDVVVDKIIDVYEEVEEIKEEHDDLLDPAREAILVVTEFITDIFGGLFGK